MVERSKNGKIIRNTCWLYGIGVVRRAVKGGAGFNSVCFILILLITSTNV